MPWKRLGRVWRAVGVERGRFVWKMPVSDLEETLAWGLTHLAPELKGWVREFQAVPGRKFRHDFAFPDSRLLIEVQGGIYQRGRSGHTGASLASDYAKLNAATCAGYRVLMFGPRDLSKRALPETLDAIRAALMAPR